MWYGIQRKDVLSTAGKHYWRSKIATFLQGYQNIRLVLPYVLKKLIIIVSDGSSA